MIWFLVKGSVVCLFEKMVWGGEIGIGVKVCFVVWEVIKGGVILFFVWIVYWSDYYWCIW